MTLWELSKQYSAAAEALRERVRLLKKQAQETDSEAERQSLLSRARILNTMRQEAHEIAVLTEHYYERNYCRNAKYIL